MIVYKTIVEGVRGRSGVAGGITPLSSVGPMVRWIGPMVRPLGHLASAGGEGDHRLASVLGIGHAAHELGGARGSLSRSLIADPPEVVRPLSVDGRTGGRSVCPRPGERARVVTA
jgi:hypothetical protein